MYKPEHEKVQQQVKIKIKQCKSNKDMDSCKRYEAILRMISNEYYHFFCNIGMETALAILKDVGIAETDKRVIYKKLLEEELSQQYKLVETDEQID